MTEFVADGPDWHFGSKVVSSVWRSLVTGGDICSVTLETQGLNPPWQGDEEDAGGFTKTFPEIPCVSQMSGGLSLRLSIPTERLSIPPGSRKGWSNSGWLGKWDGPLRTDSASLKSLESFRHLILFCSSWILAVRKINGVLIFDQSSSRKFIESWPLNSLQLHLMKTFHMSFTKIPILFW